MVSIVPLQYSSHVATEPCDSSGMRCQSAGAEWILRHSLRNRMCDISTRFCVGYVLEICFAYTGLDYVDQN